MKIVVCVKQVPDTETRVRIAPSGDAISEPDVANWIPSPYDEFAIEEAIRIKEAKGGEVVLVTLGPDRAQAALRTGLAPDLGAEPAGLPPFGGPRHPALGHEAAHRVFQRAVLVVHPGRGKVGDGHGRVL